MTPLSTWTVLEAPHVTSTREDLLSVSKDVGKAKKPAQALVSSVASYLAELRKAKGSREEQKKRLADGVPKESPKSGMKSKQDLFEMLAEVGLLSSSPHVCLSASCKSGGVIVRVEVCFPTIVSATGKSGCVIVRV